MKLRIGLLALAVNATVGAFPVRASIMYNAPQSVYTQNFDSLPNTPEDANLETASPALKWIDDAAAPGPGQFSIPGWYLYHPQAQASEGGTNQHQRMRIGAGTADTGAFMSWGSSGSTDRALGMLSSNELTNNITGTSEGAKSYFGVRFTNNTSVTLDRFFISYAGEQWREGGAPGGSAKQEIIFEFLTTAVIQGPGGIGFDALDFPSHVFGGTSSTALDGNLPENRLLRGPVSRHGIDWDPGEDLWLRWTDYNDPDNDHGLAIDDLRFMATVPEPSSIATLGIASMILSVRRQRRRSPGDVHSLQHSPHPDTFLLHGAGLTAPLAAFISEDYRRLVFHFLPSLSNLR